MRHTNKFLGALCMNKQKIFFTSIFLASIVILTSPLFAYHSDKVAASDSYTAAIGNHDSINIDNDAHLLSISRSGTSTRYILNWETQIILFQKNEATEYLNAEDPRHLELLKKMRDLAAYTAVPQRFTWGVFGSAPLNKDLQKVIDKLSNFITAQVGDEGEGQGRAEANCILANAATAEKISISAGIVGVLDSLKQPADVAWVRGGYELVTVPAPELSLDEGQASVLKNSEQFDETFAISSKVSSFACRPALD